MIQGSKWWKLLIKWHQVREGGESKKTSWIHVHYSRISSSLMCSAVILILIGALRVKNKAGAALISD